MENPFKFGTIVEENYFTDRVEEVAYIEQFSESFCVVLLTTLFGELDLNPYFCIKHIMVMKHYPRRHRHLPCDVWEGIKNLSLRFL